VDGPSLTATGLSINSGSGTLVDNGDGTWTYTPALNDDTSVGFGYTVTDGSLTAAGTANLDITPVNDAPTVAPVDLGSINEDGSRLITQADLLAGASDVDGDSLTAVNLALSSGSGTLADNGDGTWTFSPSANWNGSTAFSFDTSDGTTTTANTASLVVNPVNDAPVANDDSAAGNEDTSVTGNVLGNDTDIDSGSLTAVLVSGPSNGNLTLNTDGSFTYTPNANWNGTDSFTYKANDGALDSNVATVTLTVNPVTDLSAVDDSFTTNEDTALNNNVSTNDSTTSGGSLSYSLNLDVSHGSLTLNNDGSFSYAPTANYNGSDSFIYTVVDVASGESDSRTVSITITPVNDAPVANDDSASGNEDSVISGSVLTNDTDVEGSALTATLVSGPANGSLVLNADGSFTYTPNANFNDTDSFTYQANDGALDSNVATVTLTVNPVNDAPTTTPVTLAPIAEDSGARLITQAELLANASDIDGPGLTATGLSINSGSGTLVDNGNGTWAYTPALNDDTSVSFGYTVTDGSLTAAGTANLDITPVNDAPTTTPVTLAPMAEDSGARIITQAELLANANDVDGPSLTATGLSIASGSGSLVDNGDGTWSYTPALNDDTSVSFDYTVTDGSLTAAGTASMDITPVNDAPVANNDSASGNEDTPITGNVLGNDADVENDALAAILVSGPANGSLTLNTDGSFNYTPNANFNGTDSFTYKANDGALDSNVATVTLTVNPVNDAPTASDTTINATEDTAYGGSLPGATDVDGDPVSYALNSGAGNGTAVVNADGSFTYNPNANFNGADSFTYTISDGNGGSNTYTVTVNVAAVNDAPTVAPVDLGSINEDGSRLITQADLLAGASDVDGDTLTAVNLALTSGSGTLIDNLDGTWTFNPSTNWNGSTDFSFDTSDGTTTTANTASLTVTPVNDAPSITANTLDITEGDTVVLSNGNLNASDAEQGPAQLTFTISNLAQGQFEWAATPGVAITSFTQADIDAGLVVFVHDASDLAPAYDVTVSDGTLSQGPQAATINFAPVNEGINVTSLSGTTTTEAGGTVTFDVALNSQPFDDVTVFIVSGNPAEGTASVSSLTFTSSNWNQVQQVTVTGVNDFVVDGDQNYTIQLNGSSTDRNYNSLAAPDVALTNLDDDTAGIVISPTSGLTTSEAGASDTFSVVLTSEPLADVSIGLTSSNTAEGTVSTGTLVFTPTNWNIPQVVAVTGVSDSLNDGDVAYQVIASPASSTDPLYNGMAAGTVDVVNLNVANLASVDPPSTGSPPATTEPAPSGGGAAIPLAPEEPPGNAAGQNAQAAVESPFVAEPIQVNNTESATAAGLKTSAPLIFGNEEIHREVLTNPETQGDILLKVLEIIRADYVSGDSGHNAIVSPVHVEIVKNDNFRVEILSRGAQITAVSLSVGTVWWALRAGGLFSSLMTSLPAWRSFDVLPVLSRGPEDEDASWDIDDEVQPDGERDTASAKDLRT
jgi:VCBS repeat-containing protein